MITIARHSRSLLAAGAGLLALACNNGGSSGGGAVTLTITALNPDNADAGLKVIITGTGFEADVAHMDVSFFDNVAATILAATTTELSVTVPAGATTGPITVANGLTGESVTTTTDFTVTGGPMGTWTERNYGSAFMLNAVADSGTTVVAVGFGNTIVSSDNGIAWTARSAPDANSFILESVLWDGAQFVLVGDVVFGSPPGTLPLIATSADGTTWTRNTTWNNASGETILADVAAAGGRITAVGSNGVIVSSANAGVDWAEQVTPALTGSFIAEFKAVAAAGGTRVAVGRDVSFRGFVIASTNGVDWTEAKSGLTAFFPYGVTANGSLFVAVGASDGNLGATPAIKTSSDGVVWTTQSLPASIASAARKLTDVIWDGSQFFALGDDGATASTHLLLSSPDGITWTVETAPDDKPAQINALNGMVASPTLNVLVGDSLWTQP